MTSAGEGDNWHYHEEMELTWFSHGKGTRFAGDGIASFDAGDLVLLGGNLPHCWHVAGESSGVSIQWNFPRGHGFWSFPECSRIDGLIRMAGRGLMIRGEDAAFVSARMNGMMGSKGLERLGMFFGLLGWLSEKHFDGSDTISSKTFSLDENSLYRQSMERAVRHVITNFREEIRLSDLLEISAMSRATFSRRFKDHTGRSFSEFLLRLRLETACGELIETDQTITEIAYACGFGQISFFHRSFRNAMGCNPTEYRRRWMSV